ncbi:hypothetical protein [Streptomyces sp. NPDC060184]|uniref:hypothetical protein n=1 Tax=Streptomyces sp. NPDC060184 TaxID=3347064 RepID=UPI00365E5D8D
MRRFVDRGLLAGPGAPPDGTLHHPGQVAEVWRREDFADLVAADTLLGPEQGVARLRLGRAEFDWIVRLGRLRSPRLVEVRFGTSRAGAVDVALHTTADVGTVVVVVPAHPEIGWEQVRAVGGGRRSRR